MVYNYFLYLKKTCWCVMCDPVQEGPAWNLESGQSPLSPPITWLMRVISIINDIDIARGGSPHVPLQASLTSGEQTLWECHGLNAWKYDHNDWPLFELNLSSTFSYQLCIAPIFFFWGPEYQYSTRGPRIPQKFQGSCVSFQGIVLIHRQNYDYTCGISSFEEQAFSSLSLSISTKIRHTREKTNSLAASKVQHTSLWESKNKNSGREREG